MALEDIMRHIAQGMGIDPDLIESKIQERYIKLFEDGKYADFQALKELTGIQPQLSDGVLQFKVSRCIEDGLYAAAKDILEYTTKDKAVQIMQSMYITLLDKDDLKGLALSIRATGIRPLHSIVQSKHNEYLKKGKLDKVKILHCVTGIPVDDVEMQRRYEKCIANMHLTLMEKLREATGINPKVEPEIGRREMTKRLLQHELPNFYALVELFGAPAIYSDAEEKAIQEEYEHMVLKSRLDDIERLQNTTKIKPEFSDDTIEKAFIICFDISSFSSMQKLQKLTGKPISIPQEKLDERYTRYLAKGNINVMKELMKLTNSTPSGTIIQKKCEEYLLKGLVDRIPILSEAASYEPLFSPEVIQQAYASMLEACNIKGMRSIQEFTRTPVSLPPEKIQDGYAAIYKQRLYDKMAELFRMTKVTPGLEAGQMMHVMDHCIMHEDLETLETLYQVRSVRTSQTYDIIQKTADIYRKLAEKKDFERIGKIRNITNLQILDGTAYDLIQTEYQRLLQTREIGEARHLLEQTGVLPSAGMVQETFNQFMQSKMFEQVRQLRELTSIQPSNDEVQKLFAQYSNSGQLSMIKALHEATGIAPSEITYISIVKELLAG